MLNRKTLVAIALVAAGTAGTALADDAGNGNGRDVWSHIQGHDATSGQAAGSEDARREQRRQVHTAPDARELAYLRLNERQEMN